MEVIEKKMPEGATTVAPVMPKAKSGLDKLPKRELERNYKFYQDSLKHMNRLIEVIDGSLSSMNSVKGWALGILSYLFGYNRTEYLKAKMICEKDDLLAKVSIHEYHLSVYTDRIEEHRPIFEKEVEEMTKNWEETWSCAKLIADRNPASPIAMAIQGYDAAVADAGMDDDLRTELMNEVYKSLKFQLELFERRAKKDFNHQSKNKPLNNK